MNDSAIDVKTIAALRELGGEDYGFFDSLIADYRDDCGLRSPVRGT